MDAHPYTRIRLSPALAAPRVCRGTRIRTLTDGFGDHNATIIPYLCNIVSPTAAPLSGICIAVVGVTVAFTYGNLSDVSKSCFLCVRCRTQLQRYNFIFFLQSLFRLFLKNLFSVLESLARTVPPLKKNLQRVLGNIFGGVEYIVGSNRVVLC